MKQDVKFDNVLNEISNILGTPVSLSSTKKSHFDSEMETFIQVAEMVNLVSQVDYATSGLLRNEFNDLLYDTLLQVVLHSFGKLALDLLKKYEAGDIVALMDESENIVGNGISFKYKGETYCCYSPSDLYVIYKQLQNGESK